MCNGRNSGCKVTPFSPNNELYPLNFFVFIRKMYSGHQKKLVFFDISGMEARFRPPKAAFRIFETPLLRPETPTCFECL